MPWTPTVPYYDIPPNIRGVFQGNTGTAQTDLVGAGGLVHPAGVLVVALGLSLVGDTVGLVDRSDVVAQGDGLDGLVHAAAHGAPHLGGQGQPLHGRRLLGLLGGKENETGSYCGEKYKHV